MKSRFDAWGWFAGEATADDLERVTDVPPGAVPAERVVGELYPNWTGREWILLPYEEPQPLPEPEPDERLWWVDVGPFKDRLGMDIGAIASSSHSACLGVREFLLGRQYVDLRDPLVGSLMDVLIANNQPAPDPVWPGSGPMTPAKKLAVLTTPTTERERHIKGLEV